LELKNEPIQVQNFREFIDHFGTIYGNILQVNKENRNGAIGLGDTRISTDFMQESALTLIVKGYQTEAI
jgi:hypothetical protein